MQHTKIIQTALGKYEIVVTFHVFSGTPDIKGNWFRWDYYIIHTPKGKRKAIRVNDSVSISDDLVQAAKLELWEKIKPY